MKFTSIIRIFISVVAICSIFTVHAATTGLDKVIVVINDEPIMLSEYRIRHQREKLRFPQEALSDVSGINPGILEALIDERLQAQAAVARGLAVSGQEVDQIINIMAERNQMSLEQLFGELNDLGISPAEFRHSLAEQQLVRKIIDFAVNSRVTVSDQEVDHHLQAHKELYARNESYEISHFLMSISGKSETEIEETETTVNEIRQSLSSGHSFVEAVKNHSDGENSEEGGYLGWFREDQLPELFVDALRNLATGGYSDVLKSANGFHILNLHARDGDLEIVTQQLLRHILIQPLRRNLTDEETIELLTGIQQELVQGADFSRLARLNSDDPASALQGGMLGWVNPGEIAPRLEQLSRTLELNQVSDPVRSPFGYHLIEVLDRREKDITYDLVRKDAEAEVFKRKAAELYQIWFDQLRDSAHIEYIADGLVTG